MLLLNYLIIQKPGCQVSRAGSSRGFYGSLDERLGGVIVCEFEVHVIYHIIDSSGLQTLT